MIINGIDTKEITFVVQGPVEKKATSLCLQSIRNSFPNSRIVLSTWAGSHTDGLEYDSVVYSEDHGAAVCDLNNVNCNINRQILSSKAGLEIVKTKYVAKVRSDLII